MTTQQDNAQTRPSGATATTAGGLALVGATFWAFQTWAGLLSVSRRSGPSTVVEHGSRVDIYPSGVWIGWTVLTEVILATGLLLFGGILLLMRKLVGRWLILIGCIAAIAAVLHPVFASDYYYRSFSLSVTDCLFVLLPVLTAALAIAPSTKRWCGSY